MTIMNAQPAKRTAKFASTLIFVWVVTTPNIWKTTFVFHAIQLYTDATPALTKIHVYLATILKNGSQLPIPLRTYASVKILTSMITVSAPCALIRYSTATPVLMPILVLPVKMSIISTLLPLLKEHAYARLDGL